MGKQWKQWQTNFLGSKITADSYCSHEIKRWLFLGRKVMTNRDSILKSRDIANKCPSSQSYGFSSSHVCMWELDYKESWAPTNWCFWTVVLEKTLRVPWTARRSNQSILKEMSPEYSLEELMLKLKTLNTLVTLCEKLLHLKRPWCWERLKQEKGMTEDEMVGWHHWLNGHELE